MIGKGFYWVVYQGKSQVAFHEEGRWSICGSAQPCTDADLDKIYGTCLDGLGIEINSSSREIRGSVDRAVAAERLLREQVSTKYDGEVLCIRCHNVGTVRIFTQCKQHNPNSLAASKDNQQTHIESEEAIRKERAETWKLLNEESGRRAAVEASLRQMTADFVAYRYRCLDSPEVWQIAVRMLHKMGLDVGVITTSKFWINGVLITRPEHFREEDSDLRRELRELTLSDERDKPISTKLVIQKINHMLDRLGPDRANFIANEFDRICGPGSSCASDLRLYAGTANAEIKQA